MTRQGSGAVEPPTLFRLLLRWAAGAAEADVADGELREAFLERRRRDGSGAARRWYRRQVMGFGAAWVPTHRAIRVDASQALRAE